jgi:hypothetical protein
MMKEFQSSETAPKLVKTPGFGAIKMQAGEHVHPQHHHQRIHIIVA